MKKEKGNSWVSWYDFLGTSLLSEDKLKIIEAMIDMNMSMFATLYLSRQINGGLSSDDKKEIMVS